VKVYKATLTAEFTVEAENIAQAQKVSKRIRSLGEVAGARLPGQHDKEFTRYTIALVSEHVEVRPSPSPSEPSPGGAQPCPMCQRGDPCPASPSPVTRAPWAAKCDVCSWRSGDHPTEVKAARALLAHRKAGCWATRGEGEREP
jgi:hypothetical protein